MHDLGEQPARPSRPSLLSSGAQAEPERPRILTSLEGKAGEVAPVTAKRRGRRGWAWGGAVVVAGVLAAVVVGGGGEDERGTSGAVVAARTAPAAASMSASASASASDSAKVVASAAVAAASTSTPMPAPAVLQEPEAGNPLEALSASASTSAVASSAVASSAPASERNALAHALETPSKEAHPHKMQRKVEVAKVAPKTAKEKPAKARSASAPDNDVVLLAALMSHMQSRNKKATVTERLEVCKQYNAAGQVQCRARICAGVDAKEAVCKSAVSAGIVPSDS